MIIGWRYLCILKIGRRCILWIRIPIIVWLERPFEPPRPDPPWLQGEKIRPELAHDLQVLATIDALAQTLSETHRKATLHFVQTLFDALELPEGMSVLSEQDLKANQ